MFSRCVVAYLLAVCLSALSGCGGKPDPNETSPTVLYDQHCAKCHARAGEPGGPSLGGSKGPDISKVGGNKEHTADWLADYIRDPKGKKPDSKMPAFGGTLTDAQIKELADYLAAKK